MGLLEGFAVFGSTIADVLNDWVRLGVFDYVLPFLLIFAIVFAILDSIEPFKSNKGVVIIISIVVGLLSLQFDFVPLFFSSLFPFTGIAIAILLVVLILISFMPGASNDNRVKNSLLIAGAILVVFVLLSAFSSPQNIGIGWMWGWPGFWWVQQYSSAIVVLIIIAVLIGLVVSRSRSRESGVRGTTHG